MRGESTRLSHKDVGEFLRASHVVNLSQGAAFRAIKAANPKLQVGTAFSMTHCEPATGSAEDKAAAERAHALTNVWFLDTGVERNLSCGISRWQSS